jgi:L-fucose mutarotase
MEPMLKSPLLHPEILSALGSAGHGAKILVADGNYPFETQAGNNAKKVYLNLAPGTVTVPEVLAVLNVAVEIEATETIVPEDGTEPEIFRDYTEILGEKEMRPLNRYEFYEAARQDDVCLVIATGELRTFACILLTIGVVKA